MLKRRKYIFITILILVVVAAAVVLYISQIFDLKIGGDKIDKEEFVETMNRKVSKVTGEFTEKSNVTVDEEFWNTEIEGEIPSHILADRTIDELKKIKAVYLLAKEKGYIDKTTYKDLKKRWEDENKRRAEKISKGEPVYGLAEFTLDLYLEYEMDSLQKKYCDDIENEGMDITEEERKKFYEANKDKRYRKDDDITLEYIKVDCVGEGLHETETAELKKLLSDLYKRMEEGQSLAEEAGTVDELRPYVEQKEIPSGEAGVNSRMIGDVLEYAAELGKGEISQVIEENGCLYLIQCTDRTEYDYEPLSGLKDNINKELREKNYDALIEKRASELRVEGNMEHIYEFTEKQMKN